MIKENFYTGEPIVNSPPEKESYISEAEAVQNASFGQNFAQAQYGLGGNAYLNNQQFMNGPGFSIFPQGEQLRNTSYYNPYPNYMANPQAQQVQYGNPYGNPVFNYQQEMYMRQQQAMQAQRQRQALSHLQVVQPIKLCENEYLPMEGWQDEIDRLSRQYIEQKLEQEAIEVANRSRNVMNGNYSPYGGYNYFANPMYGNPNNAPAPYERAIYKRIEEMKNQAREARTDLSIRLSKIAHSYLQDGVDDEQIELMYRGQSVDVTQDKEFEAIFNQMQFQERFSKMVEIDPAAPYRQAYAEIQKEREKYIPKNATKEQFEEGINQLMLKWEMDKEKARRRNCLVNYKKNEEDNTYKYLVRRKKAEDIARSQGFSLDPDAPMQTINQINKIALTPENENTRNQIKKRFGELLLQNKTLFPALEGYIDDDGNLVASMDLTKAEEVARNQEESQYNAHRNAFYDFTQTIPKINEKPPDMIRKKLEEHNAFLGTAYTLTKEVLEGKIGGDSS